MSYVKLGADKIWFGSKALDALDDLASKRVFIVECGEINLQVGFRKIVTDILERNGCQWEVFAEVEPEPCFDTIEKGAAAISRFSPDWIVGFGGGSAMDAAKAMWVFYENDVCSYKELCEIGGIRHMGEKAKLMCIPTSSGTGSEVTKAAIIKDSRTHHKYPIVDLQARLIPSVAVLYPAFTVSMPPTITAACGMDVVTHAVESFVSKSANNFSDVMAEGAFRLAVENISRACEHGDDLNAREAMLEASCMAGSAFTNSGLGISHAVAHAIGGYTGLPHGLINAVILPEVIIFNAKDNSTAKKYRKLARDIGTDDLAAFIRMLNARIGIPSSLNEVMNGKEWTTKEWDDMVQAALDDVNLRNNPREADAEQMSELITRMYVGEEKWEK